MRRIKNEKPVFGRVQVVKDDDDGACARLQMDFVEGDVGAQRTAGSWFCHNLNPYRELMVDCQFEMEGRAYAFQTRYQECYAVNLERCEQMYKTLYLIDKGLKKIADVEGYPETFGQYASRVARVLRAEKIRIDRGKNGISEVSLGQGIDVINNLVKEETERRWPVPDETVA